MAIPPLPQYRLVLSDFLTGACDEQKNSPSYFCLILWSSPNPCLAQCSDPLCKNLQTILDADFRGYRLNKEVGPEGSIEGTKVPCQPSTWANNVPMYICYAQVPFPDSQKWFARTLQALQSLNAAWHFQINSPGEDHYVDAGPPDCEIRPLKDRMSANVRSTYRWRSKATERRRYICG